MKLGGYHRLWVVLSVLYLIIVIIFLIHTWPNVNNIPNKKEFYEALDSDIKKIIINTPQDDELGFVPNASNPIEMPNKYIIYFKQTASKEEMQMACATYWYQVEKEALHQKIKHLFIGILSWLIPCVIIYILGFIISWVIQGFKSRS